MCVYLCSECFYEGRGDDTAIYAVLCAYLEGDVQRIRASLLLGSIVPLLAFLVWNAIALGLSSQAQRFADPVELLMR